MYLQRLLDSFSLQVYQLQHVLLLIAMAIAPTDLWIYNAAFCIIIIIIIMIKTRMIIIQLITHFTRRNAL